MALFHWDPASGRTNLGRNHRTITGPVSFCCVAPVHCSGGHVLRQCVSGDPKHGHTTCAKSSVNDLCVCTCVRVWFRNRAERCAATTCSLKSTHGRRRCVKVTHVFGMCVCARALVRAFTRVSRSAEAKGISFTKKHTHKSVLF